MIKESVHQKDTTILNIRVPKNRASSHMKRKLVELKGEIDNSTIAVGDFSPPLSVLRERTGRKSVGFKRPKQQYQPIGPN